MWVRGLLALPPLHFFLTRGDPLLIFSFRSLRIELCLNVGEAGYSLAGSVTYVYEHASRSLRFVVCQLVHVFFEILLGGNL